MRKITLSIKRSLVFVSLLTLAIGILAMPSVLTLRSQAAIRSPQWKRPAISRKREPDFYIQSSGVNVTLRRGEPDIAGSSEANNRFQSLSIASRFEQDDEGNIQVNDPALDSIQFPAGFRPVLGTIQTNPSIAAHEHNIVAGYLSFANAPVSIVDGSVVRDHSFGAAFSVSTNGGETWRSGFFPNIPGYSATGNIANVTVDRRGSFYCQTIGKQTPTGIVLPGTLFPQLAIQLNESTDGGINWSEGMLVDQDEGNDHANIAVGRDPIRANRDNIYITWLSFHGINDGDPARLRFGRSTDGGATWIKKTLAEDTLDDDPTMPQFVGDSVLYVDPATGRLYIAYQYLSDADVDFIRLLVSDDAGETFSPVAFNLSGARFADLVSFVQPGEFIDCGNGGAFRLTIHSGADIGGGRFGLARYINASRVNTAPTFAAREGALYLVYSTSTSPSVGVPDSHSNVMLLRSTNGGASWRTIQVNTDAPTDTQHVMPSLVIDNDSNDVHVGYYTQHNDGTVDLDLANSHNRGGSFPANRKVRITSAPFSLSPTNIPVPTASRPFATTNYDFFAPPCFNLGSLAHSPNITYVDKRIYVVWTDNRNRITEPAHSLNPLSGQTHSQVDIFFQAVEQEARQE